MALFFLSGRRRNPAGPDPFRLPRACGPSPGEPSFLSHVLPGKFPLHSRRSPSDHICSAMVPLLELSQEFMRVQPLSSARNAPGSVRSACSVLHARAQASPRPTEASQKPQAIDFFLSQCPSSSLSVRVRFDHAQLRPGCLFVRVQEQCFHFFVCPF
jgi:hypothetical protein